MVLIYFFIIEPRTTNYDDDDDNDGGGDADDDGADELRMHGFEIFYCLGEKFHLPCKPSSS